MPLTKEELIQRLKMCAAMNDSEFAYDTAVDLLLVFIDDEEIEEAFCDVR